jgi:hypothetical protein
MQRLELVLARHAARLREGSETPTPQALLAYRDLSTDRFVMARLAETAY